MVSRALNNINPFSEEILDLTNSQVNFILRLYAEEHPDEYKIMDPDITEGKNIAQIQVAWSNKLAGKTKEEFDKNPIIFLNKYYNWSK